jgi:hypothetical protein
MAPVGSNVQYLSQKDGHPLAAVVVESFSGSCVNLKVFLDGSNSTAHGYPPEEYPNGCAWETSVIRGDDPGEWRLVPQVESGELAPDASEDEAAAEASETESASVTPGTSAPEEAPGASGDNAA